MSTRWIKHLAFFCGAWFALSASMGGCHCAVHNNHAHHPSPVYVSGPPPASKAENKPAAPSADHVWVDGHWGWNEADDGWDWIPGAWQLPPAGGWVWEEGSYEENQAGGVFTPGHWVQLEAKSGPESKSKGKLGIGDARPDRITKAESKSVSSKPGSSEAGAQSGVQKAEGRTVDLEAAKDEEHSSKPLGDIKKVDPVEAKKGKGPKTVDSVKKGDIVKKAEGSKKKVSKSKIKATGKKSKIKAKSEEEEEEEDEAPDTDVLEKVKKVKPLQKRPVDPTPNPRN